MSEVDRLRSALASRGRAHAAIAGRISADTLPAALVELGREIVGADAWTFVVGSAKPRGRAAR